MDSTYAQVPLLFARSGGRFERVLPDVAGRWLGEEHVDRSAAFGDLDLDGDVDIVVGGVNQKLRVLANGARGHWLAVELVDARAGVGNRHAIGAKVVLGTGADKQTRWIVGGGSYQAVSTTVAHFGLATADKANVEVTWPDGATQQVDALPADQRVVVRRQ
jgi:hypothetical protein